MTRKSILIYLVLIFSVTNWAKAEEPTPQKQITISKTSSPPQIDGKLDDACWKNCEIISDLVQYEPENQAPPTESTCVYITYDDDNIYFAFHCFDKEPNKIVANLCRRDHFDDDDFVGVILDTYNDKRNAFWLCINPYGAQMDLVGNGNEQDDRWDIVWNSAGEKNECGWTAEMAIPFKQLRFSQKENQVWGINIVRRITRKHEDIFWTKLNRDQPLLEHSGLLLGINKIKSGKNLELLPYASIGHSQQLEEKTTTKDIGLDAKYGITPNLTLDLTLNPDYGQIEADVVQINLTPYETFYSERRPFFMEGFQIFETPIMLFYSRRITNPKFGAKLSGKVGGYSLGVVQAIDEVEGQKDQYYSVIRITKDVLKSSSVGFFFTDKENDIGTTNAFTDYSSYNRTLGIDGKFSIKNINWIILQAAKSFTKDIRGNDNAYYFEVGHYPDVGIYGNVTYIRAEENFIPHCGYISQPNRQRIISFIGYRLRPTKLGIKNMGIETYLKKALTNNGDEIYTYPGNEIWINFKNNIWFGAVFNWNGKEIWEDKVYKPITEVHLEAGLGSSGPIDFGWWYYQGKSIIYDYQILGFERFYGIWTDLKPFHNLSISPSVEYYSQFEKADKGKILDYYSLVTRIDYQLNKNIFLKLFAQSNTYIHEHQYQILLGYRFRPGSNFYISFGETRDNSEGNFKLTNRTLFTKASWWWGV